MTVDTVYCDRCLSTVTNEIGCSVFTNTMSDLCSVLFSLSFPFLLTPNLHYTPMCISSLQACQRTVLV